MKHLFLLGATLLLLTTLSAQKTFKKAFSGSNPKVNFLIEKSQLEISGYNGNELIIESADGWSEPPARAKGLKSLYNSAEDNTGVGLEIQEAGGVMTISKARSTTISYKIKVPLNTDIKIEVQDWQSEDIHIKDVTGEIEITGKSSNIKLENVTGPVVSNSVNGDMEVKFSKLNQSKPSHISTINGFVDVTIPSDTKAKLSFYTINGEVYTDADVKFPAENANSKGLKAIRRNVEGATLNGSGVELTLKSINGDLYLRKK
jgi:hypothetical protein